MARASAEQACERKAENRAETRHQEKRDGKLRFEPSEVERTERGNGSRKPKIGGACKKQKRAQQRKRKEGNDDVDVRGRIS